MSKQINIKKLHVFNGHKDAVTNIQQFSQQHFFSSSFDGQVILWDLKNLNTAKLVAKVQSSIYALHYDNERSILIIGENHFGIHIIDMIEKVKIKSISFTESKIFDIKTDENNIYIATGEGILYVINYDSLDVYNKIKLGDKNLRRISLGNDKIVVGNSEGLLNIIDVNDFRDIKYVRAHETNVKATIFTPNNNYLISSGMGSKYELKIWKASDFELEKIEYAHMYEINDMIFINNYKYLATCSMDKTIKLWGSDLKLLKVIDKDRYDSHLSSVNRLLWMDNKLISCSDDKKIIVWEI